MAKTKRPISVIDRRLQSGSVFAAGTRPIPLVDPDQWTVRIVNSQISDARIWEMQAEKGWVYLEPADVACKPEDLGFRVVGGRIVRGTNGHEVLMKMPRRDYRRLQQKKDADNRKQTFGKKAVKDAIVQAASAEPGGDQGATLLERQPMTVVDSLERVSLEP